jgi:hypothetical protein
LVMTDLARYKERQSLIRAELYKVQTS